LSRPAPKLQVPSLDKLKVRRCDMGAQLQFLPVFAECRRFS
jgi:hypothetical protein